MAGFKVIKGRAEVGVIEIKGNNFKCKTDDIIIRKAVEKVKIEGGYPVLGGSISQDGDNLVDGHSIIKPTADNIWLFEDLLPLGYTVVPE